AFTHGIETPEAIKAFLAYASRNWSVAPRYVVLAGKGTFDYKGFLGTGDCLVPPMLVATHWGLFASDNWFVDLDDDLLPDIALGRLPAAGAEELGVLVDKIIAYETAAGGEWQKRILLAADNRDSGGNFTAASEALADRIPAGHDITRSYLDHTSVSEAREILLGGVDRGVAFMNYFGHGGPDRMAGEGLLKSSDVGSLANGSRLPIVTAMTCFIGRFEMPGYNSLAEQLLLSRAGGSVAVWSPTGMSMNHPAKLLSLEFYSALSRQDGQLLGDAMLTGMRGFAAQSEARSTLAVYGLLGDPALRIPTP
ncbi:C25 family cysteine peptidase, partial [Verrucomicrobiota bacterium]